MTSRETILQAVGLPFKQLPIVPEDYPTMTTATGDNRPGCFDTDIEESITIPQGWNMHFDVITEIRIEGHWEGVRRMIAAAVKLSKTGSEFAELRNQMVEECFGYCSSTDSTVEIELKGANFVAAWNEKMAKSRREVERELRVFVDAVCSNDLERQVKRCFRVHRNLGVDGDGEKWWEKTVELLLLHGEEWMAASFTLEMWLEELAAVVEKEKGKEVRVYADALCASYERAEGMKSRRELVYVVKGGKLSKKGKEAWISVELGHVTDEVMQRTPATTQAKCMVLR